MKRVTLQQLADATSLSRATVSRAMRNHPAIAEETIRRVHEAAERLGYRPDARVSDLMHHLRLCRKPHDRPIIAMILQRERPHDLLVDSEGGEGVVAGAVRRAESQGYQVEPFFILPGGNVAGSLSRVLCARGIRGAIIAPLQDPEYNLQLDWKHFSVVAIGYTLKSVQLHRAVSHQYQTLAEAVSQVLDLGYTRIGCVLSQHIDARTDYIYRGAFYAMREKYGRERFVPLLDYTIGDPSPMLRWYTRFKPDVIIGVGAHDHMVLPQLLKAGVRCPADVGYASVHLARFDGSVSGVKQNSFRVGAAAVDLLVNAMRHNECGVPAIAHTELIHGTWIHGETTRCQVK